MSESAIGENCPLELYQKKAKRIIDSLKDGGYVKDSEKITKELQGDIYLSGNVLFDILRAINTLDLKYPYKCKEFTIEEIRKQIELETTSKDYGEETIRLSLQVWEFLDIIIPISSSHYAIEPSGWETADTLEKLAEEQPEEYGKFVRESFSANVPSDFPDKNRASI